MPCDIRCECSNGDVQREIAQWRRLYWVAREEWLGYKYPWIRIYKNSSLYLRMANLRFEDLCRVRKAKHQTDTTADVRAWVEAAREVVKEARPR